MDLTPKVRRATADCRSPAMVLPNDSFLPLLLLAGADEEMDAPD